MQQSPLPKMRHMPDVATLQNRRLSKDLKAGATVGGIEAVSKMILYYVHERVWERALIRLKV